MARLIKRYSNRKMYDPEASAYVSLDDIAVLVRAGETVEIVDNVTNQEITAQVLTQIILEEEKRGRTLLPTDLLHDLLRRGGKVIDTGFEQIRHGVDDLVQSSLGRLTRVLPGRRDDELRQLREQLVHLEQTLADILEEKGSGQDG